MVGPGPDAGEPLKLLDQLASEFRGDFEYEFSIGDVLVHNHLELPSDVSKRNLPFVARVPEGAETDIARRLMRFPSWQIGAATPDYLIRPSASIAIDQSVLDQVMARMGATPGSPGCGHDCVVGVLDSGIDPHYVPHAPLHARQYDALSPSSAGAFGDATGHGSLVARIVNSVAPGAILVSVKVFDQDGTISSIIAGLYLAHAAGPCDILNLSLKVSCDPDPCAVCQTPRPAAANFAQLDYFFKTFMQAAPGTVLIAAAGNNTTHLTLPAAFDGIIAVGSFDYAANSPISRYQQVPSTRFVLAPGGQNTSGRAFAHRPGYSKPEYLYGTSFSAAFISGFATKTICNAKNRSCGTPRRGSPAPSLGSGALATVIGEIDARADRTWSGFDPMVHGLGAIHF